MSKNRSALQCQLQIAEAQLRRSENPACCSTHSRQISSAELGRQARDLTTTILELKNALDDLHWRIACHQRGRMVSMNRSPISQLCWPAWTSISPKLRRSRFRWRCKGNAPSLHASPRVAIQMPGCVRKPTLILRVLEDFSCTSRQKRTTLALPFRTLHHARTVGNRAASRCSTRLRLDAEAYP